MYVTIQTGIYRHDIYIDKSLKEARIRADDLAAYDGDNYHSYEVYKLDKLGAVKEFSESLYSTRAKCGYST